jgi:hypothetical protein
MYPHPESVTPRDRNRAYANAVALDLFMLSPFAIAVMTIFMGSYPWWLSLVSTSSRRDPLKLLD